MYCGTLTSNSLPVPLSQLLNSGLRSKYKLAPHASSPSWQAFLVPITSVALITVVFMAHVVSPQVRLQGMFLAVPRFHSKESTDVK